MGENNRIKKHYLVEKKSVINARPQDIFNVLMNVERWNQWTKSITKISILDSRQLAPGVKIKVLQPKLPPTIWTIKEIIMDKLLTWEKRYFGFSMLSEHLIMDQNNEISVTIRVTYNGPLAGLFYKLTHTLTDNYMTLEINGLKRECEQ
jgi:hypothetical protein